MIKWLALASCLFLCCACGPATLYEETKQFPESTWAYDDPANFVFEVVDTVQRYDIVLTVDHGIAFANQNFYVLLTTTLPSGSTNQQEVSLQLAGEFGAWLGNCGSTNCALSIPILENVRYGVPGAYQLTVAQHTRNNPLAAVNSIGLRVAEVE